MFVVFRKNQVWSIFILCLGGIFPNSLSFLFLSQAKRGLWNILRERNTEWFFGSIAYLALQFSNVIVFAKRQLVSFFLRRVCYDFGMLMLTRSKMWLPLAQTRVFFVWTPSEGRACFPTKVRRRLRQTETALGLTFGLSFRFSAPI